VSRSPPCLSLQGLRQGWPARTRYPPLAVLLYASRRRRPFNRRRSACWSPPRRRGGWRRRRHRPPRHPGASAAVGLPVAHGPAPASGIALRLLPSRRRATTSSPTTMPAPIRDGTFVYDHELRSRRPLEATLQRYLTSAFRPCRPRRVYDLLGRVSAPRPLGDLIFSGSPACRRSRVRPRSVEAHLSAISAHLGPYSWGVYGRPVGDRPDPPCLSTSSPATRPSPTRAGARRGANGEIYTTAEL